MAEIKIGILKEGKTPPDKRVPLSPIQCRDLITQYPNLSLVVQKSPFRCFDDEEYANLGIPLVDDVSDCDVLFGIKKSNKFYSTFNNFNNKVISGKRIDYIFIKNLKNIKSTHVHLKTLSKNWASDHHPVLSELKF